MPTPSPTNTSCPHENTFDYALMFVPSEGVYYELLMTQDTKYGRLDEYCRGKRVFPVSPNTFYACLNAVAISLQGQKIEENARQLLAGMAGLQKAVRGVSLRVYEKIGGHLRHAQQCYEEADSQAAAARAILSSRCPRALFRKTRQKLSSLPPTRSHPAISAIRHKPNVSSRVSEKLVFATTYLLTLLMSGRALLHRCRKGEGTCRSKSKYLSDS